MNKKQYCFLIVFLSVLSIIISPPTAHSLPIALPGDIIINEFLADPAFGIAGDANGDGVRKSSEDEFIELVNITSNLLDIGSFTLNDARKTRHTFPAGTTISAGQAIVVFGGGSPSGFFGGAQVFTASSLSLSLNNGGDTITFFDLSSNIIDTLTYGSEGNKNESLTRDPDLNITNPLVLHSTASGSGGALFSPGTMINGSSFAAPVPEPGTLILFTLGLAGLAVFIRKFKVS